MAGSNAAAEVTLREITDSNRAAVARLAVAPAQQRFVGTVAGALAVAAETPEGRPWFRAVYAGGEPVGFVMVSWDVEPDPPHIIGPWFLWKLLIDAAHQGRGHGRAVVDLIAALVRAEGGSELLTSHVEGPGDPGPFYRRIGFRPTGERDDNDEVVLALRLT